MHQSCHPIFSTLVQVSHFIIPYLTSCAISTQNNIYCKHLLTVPDYLTYMRDKLLQHPYNAHSCEHQLLCDYSSAEKTPSQSSPRYPEIFDQSLVQIQLERWLCLLKEKYCNRITFCQINSTLYENIRRSTVVKSLIRFISNPVSYSFYTHNIKCS